MLAVMGGEVAAQGIPLEGIVVTSTKTPEPAIDALSGTSTVGKEQLDQQFQGDKVSQMLPMVPGMTVAETGQDTAQSINIRGLQDFGRVNVLIEGMRQNFQRSGHNANGAFYLEPEMLKSVDITRGPTSTIYGSGAIGGVVAFQLMDADDILKPGELAAHRTRTRYGTNGEGKLVSETGAVKAGNFDVIGQLNGRWSNDYEDGAGNTVPNSGDTTKSGYAKARWRPLAGHEFTGTLIDYSSEFVDRVGTVQRDTDVANRQYALGYTFASPTNPLMDFSAKAYRNETDLSQTRLTFSPFEPVGSRRSFNVATEGFDVFNTSRFRFGSAKLALTYGADGFRDTVATSDPVGNGDEFTPGGERSVVGSFIQGKLTFFDRLDVIAALRYDSYQLESDDASVSSDGSRISPKITVGYTPVKGITLFSTYAEGYRAPAVTETLIDGIHPPPAPFPLKPNPNLRPEVAHNLEAGVNFKYDSVFKRNDLFRARLVAFRNKVDDFIDAVSVFDPTSPLFFHLQYQNIAEATLEGVELEAMYDARAWFLGLGAHYIRGTNEENGEGLYSVAPPQLTLTAGFRAFDNKLVAGARGRFVAEQDRVPVSTTTILPPSDGYGLLDLFAQYQFNETAVLNLSVDNVFDRNYREFLDRENSPGLSARVGMTIRFGATPAATSTR
jgi:hemoglobin/transferrin/lactoferrin receptor protein